MEQIIGDSVSDIRRLLIKDYPVSSIFKELIQNADDARAQQLHFGWIADWPEGIHPLLRQPVLLALNDGPFSKRDEKSILRLGLSGKASDVGTIGTFGLGMKSVFHLCEGFFYACSADQEARDGSPFVEFLTPHEPIDHVKNWEDHEKHAAEIILKKLGFWGSLCKRWFCIMIPLRRDEHLGAPGPLHESRPELETLYPYSPKEEIIHCFTPLLKSLEQMTFWDWNPDSIHPEKAWRMAFEATGLQRTLFPHHLKPGVKSAIGGTVKIEVFSTERTSTEYSFIGNEILLSDPIFNEIKSEIGVKKNRDVETGEYVTPKNDPHCAVMFSTTKSLTNEDSTFLIERSTFLPLARTEVPRPLNGKRKFRLTLHGGYFLDPGRQAVINRSGSDRGIEEKWNDSIDELGVWPLILPTLSKFVEDTEPGSLAIINLTRSLQESEAFKNNKQSICSKYQWLRQIVYQDSGWYQWKLLDRDQEYLILPEPDKGSNHLPFEVFPNLKTISDDRVLTFKRQPSLTVKNPSTWQYGDASELLQNLGVTALKSHQGAQYLNSFLNTLDGSVRQKLIRICVRSLMHLIMEVGIEETWPFKDNLKELLAQFPRENIVFLDLRPDLLAKLTDIWVEFESNQILIPSSFITGDFGCGEIKQPIAERLLKWLVDESNLNIREKADVSLAILEKTQGKLYDKLVKLGDHKLFHVFSYPDEIGHTDSWKELHVKHLDGILFSEVELKKSSFIESFRKAVRNTKYYYFKPVRIGFQKLFTILFEGTDEPFRQHHCIKALSRCPDLESPDCRKDLLEKLFTKIKDPCDPEQAKAIRYLLQGDRNQYEDVETPLWIESLSDDKTILKRIAREGLSRLPNRWRVVPKELAEVVAKCLNKNQKDQLHIGEFNSNQLEAVLREHIDLSWIADLNLSSLDRWELLNAITNDVILRRLPIHKTVKGELISIESSNLSKIFLISTVDFRLSSDTEDLVTLLERPGNQQAVDRLKRLINNQVWKPFTALETALQNRTPSWKDVLTALGSLERQTYNTAYLKLIHSCQTTSWIPTGYGLKSPQDLVKGKDESGLSSMLSANGPTEKFFGIADILPECRNHECFPIIEELLAPKDEEILKGIASYLKKNANYLIGNLPERIDEPDFLDSFLFVLMKCPVEVTATSSLVRALLDAGYSKDSIRECFIRQLSGPLKKERLKLILKACKTIHEQADKNERPKIIRVFNWYLGILTETASLIDLHGLHLMNRDGQWKLTSEICLDMDGIPASNLLDDTQAKVLRKLVNTKTQTRTSLRGNKQNERIMKPGEVKQYFMQFEDFVPYRTIGAFLSLLGDEEYIRSMAEEYLAPEKIDEFRSARIDWTPLEGLSPNYTDVDYDNLLEVMYIQRFRFFLSSQDGSCYIPNLVGDVFKAQLNQNYGSLVVHHLESNDQSETSRDYRYFDLILRDIKPDELEKKEVKKLLAESARYLLEKVYNRKPKNLDFLGGHEETEQLALGIAQQLILKHFVFYFKQLGEKRLSTIREIVTEWRNTEIREELGKMRELPHIDKVLRSCNKRFDELRRDLRKKLEVEQGVQNQLLEVVRRKIREDYQYMPDSIPFELFQNADDASKELFHMGNVNHRPMPDIFHMYSNDFSLIFLHSGRQINQHRRRTFSSEEGEAAGYDSDLEKMLVMSYSDKNDQNFKVTGKFGLGFKSVFIVSSRPKVLSGPLGFEVVAGMYPKRLNKSDRTRLKDMIKEKLNSYDGTIFEIGFDEPFWGRPREVNERFLKLVPVILVFSRQIKKCVLQVQGGPEETLVHSEKPISDCPGAFVTNLRFPFSGDIGDCEALVLRTGDFGALLLSLNMNGVGRFSEKLPTFWNLAPLGKEGLGFAVNGNFLLDVGRAQIAEPIERHEDVSKDIGLSLGDVLVRMCQVSETNWRSLSDELGFSPEATPYQMWESFWRLLGADLANENSGQKRERDLCKQMFWQRGRGMAKLFETKDAIPSALSSAYKCLTNLKNIYWFTTGMLDVEREVFETVSGWEQFRQSIPTNMSTLVSESRIKRPLEWLISTEYDWNRVDIKSALMWELKRYPKVFPEQAEKLGELINPNHLEEWTKNYDSNESIAAELEILREFLCDLQFRTAAGSFLRCQYIVVSDHGNELESRQADFAPAEKVLDSAYGEKGIAFLKACRGPKKVSLDNMQQWVREAKDVERQKAFLRYLSSEDEGFRDLWALIQEAEPGAWLKKVDETQAFNELEPRDQKRLNLQLVEMLESDEVEHEIYPQNECLHNKQVSPRPDCLERIYKWWETDRNGQLVEYERKIYPNGQFFLLDGDSSSDADRKKEWLKMFLLGCLQTIGWVTHDRKRDFIERSESLIRKLIHVEDDKDVWLSTYDRVIEQQIDDFPSYRSHLALFGLYVIGRRLTEYIDLVLKVNDFHPETVLSISKIFAPRANPEHQHGGLDMPPINRVLGIGAHFVIRELHRKGIIEHKKLHRLCYVPNEKLRGLLECLGCEGINRKELKPESRSVMISKFLTEKLGQQKALFQNDFDIPLQVIAYDVELQSEFIGYQLPVTDIVSSE